MEPINFGKTPYKINRLGFGIMRLPVLADGKLDFELSTPLIRYALKHGVNLLDSHPFYHNGQSEEAVGKAIEGLPRNKIILQTKIGMYNNYTEAECWRLLEQSLTKMKTEYIDFYFAHDLRWKDYLKYGKLFRGFTQKALDQKLIRYRGFSSHDTPKNIKKLIDAGWSSAMLVQYNLLDRANEEVIAFAREKGLGVEVMGPVAGGMLGSSGEEILKNSPPGISSTAELAFKFVLANTNIHAALSGMSSLRQIKENIANASGAAALTPENVEKLDEIFEKRKKVLNLFCTGCQYCFPCPNKVNIPRIFKLYNFSRVYGLKENARQKYAGMTSEEKASGCRQCGKCEQKCPQKIPIRKKLKEIESYFEKRGSAKRTVPR